jgi:hypothetical protein
VASKPIANQHQYQNYNATIFKYKKKHIKVIYNTKYSIFFNKMMVDDKLVRRSLWVGDI